MSLWPELRRSEGQSGVKGEHSLLHEQNLRKRLRLLGIHRPLAKELTEIHALRDKADRDAGLPFTRNTIDALRYVIRPFTYQKEFDLSRLKLSRQGNYKANASVLQQSKTLKSQATIKREIRNFHNSNQR